MGIETLIGQLVKDYGSTGAIIGLGIYAIRELLPLITQAVQQLVKMANAMQKLTLQLHALGITVTEIRAQQGEIQEDIAALYTFQSKPRPSRRVETAGGD